MIQVRKSEPRSTIIAALLSTATVMFHHHAVAQVAPTFEASVLNEINQIRANPQAYADWLTNQRQNYQNIPGSDLVSGNVAELWSGTQKTPFANVSLMLLSDGDSNRGVRRSLFQPNYQTAEVACGVARPSQQAKRPMESASQPSVKPAPRVENSIERAIVEETNRLRANPQAYAAELAELRQYFSGNILKHPGYPALVTQEGVAAVDEAIRDLRATAPLSALSISQGLSLGARDHVLDLGPKGKAGHYGTDGSDPFQRMNRYGTWKGSAGENISFSPIATAKWHMRQLVIDDGVKNRGHRKALLNPDYRVTGSACGNHTVYGQMCVMTYSKDYQEGNVQGRR